MEQLIHNYYNSPKFKLQRDEFEKKGMSKEHCLEVIKSNLTDMNKLTSNLDTITQHNIKTYFKELSTNSTINDLLYNSVEQIFMKHFPKKHMKNVFEEMISKVSQSYKQLEILENIHNDLNKFTKEYTRQYFNNISLDKQITDLIRCNLTYIIKKEFGGNINIGIEQTITEMYKKNIGDINVNMDKVRILFIEENIPFEELLTATFQNIETKMVEQSHIIVSNEIKIYQDKNREAMGDYLNNIDIHVKDSISKTQKCEDDIINILETLEKLTEKLENMNKTKGKSNIELIKRVVEQNIQKTLNFVEQNIQKTLNEELITIIKKTLDNQVENVVSLLLDSKLQKIFKKIDENHKKFAGFKSNEFKSFEKRINLLETENSKLMNKQKILESKVSKINHLESKINHLESKIEELQNTMNTLYNDTNSKVDNELLDTFLNKTNELESKINKCFFKTEKMNEGKRIDKLYNIFTDTSNKLNKKFSDSYKSSHESFSKIDDTLKSMSEKSVTNDIRYEELIYKKLDEQIPKLSEIVSGNIQKGYFESMRDITQRITDLQSQITMINQYTFNMPKTYLFQ